MKKVCLIVGIGFLFGFIWTQKGVGDDEIFERRLPRARQKYAPGEVIVKSKPGVPGNGRVALNSRYARLRRGRIFRKRLPRGRATYAPGEIIVKFKPDAPEQVIRELNSRHDASVIYTSPFADFKRLRIRKDKTAAEMVELYKENPDVEYAELNYIAYACWVPNDTYYYLQWHLDNPQYGGIQMEDAWELLGAPGTPGESVIVAVVDTGVACEDYPTDKYWHLDTYNAYSGHSWWCGVKEDPNWATPPGYSNLWEQYLIHEFDLTGATGDVTLSFRHKYDTESGYDYGYVEVSDDNGSSWTGLKSYSGNSHGWRRVQALDLTAYKDKTILLRFRFNSDYTWSDGDGYYNSDGAWYIDEVKITDNSDTLFYDDMESGVGNWQVDSLPFQKAPDLANTNFVAGYDFIDNDLHPNDDDGHGTHVTGTIAQSTNNNLGVAGIAFNTTIMPVKVLGPAGGTYQQVADGIYYATNNGANVINLSLGGASSSTTLEDAVAYAYDNGVTVIAAAGNDGSSTISYPAAYDDYVIAVGATRYDEQLAYYSNYGTSLDVVAPGGQLIDPVTGKKFDQNGDGYADGVCQQTFGNTLQDWGYYFYQGTSMAAPHVSGVAALLIAYGVITPDGVRAALQDTAEDLGDPGPDDIYGYGLVDAYAALMSYTTVEEIYFQGWEGATREEQIAGWYSKYEPKYGPDYDPILIVDDPVPPSGTWSQKVLRVDAASNYLSPLIEVTAGERYIVSAWINWVSGGWPFVGVSRYNASGSPMGLPLSDPETAPRLIWLIGKGDYHTREGYDPIGDWVTPVPIVDGWNYYEKVFTVPEGTAYVRIMTELWKGASRGGDPLAYFDDIAMYAIAPGSSYGE